MKGIVGSSRAIPCSERDRSRGRGASCRRAYDACSRLRAGTFAHPQCPHHTPRRPDAGDGRGALAADGPRGQELRLGRPSPVLGEVVQVGELLPITRVLPAWAVKCRWLDDAAAGRVAYELRVRAPRMSGGAAGVALQPRRCCCRTGRPRAFQVDQVRARTARASGDAAPCGPVGGVASVETDLVWLNSAAAGAAVGRPCCTRSDDGAERRQLTCRPSVLGGFMPPSLGSACRWDPHATKSGRHHRVLPARP
jgi:hypothetical protein